MSRWAPASDAPITARGSRQTSRRACQLARGSSTLGCPNEVCRSSPGRCPTGGPRVLAELGGDLPDVATEVGGVLGRHGVEDGHLGPVGEVAHLVLAGGDLAE